MKCVAVQPPDTLLMELATGKRYSVNLSVPMADLSRFDLLQDSAIFATAQVVDWGCRVEWACGLSMASAWLHQIGKGRQPVGQLLCFCKARANRFAG